MSFRSPLVRRTLAASAVTVAALAGLTACDLLAPQDTLHIEEASVGASATVGQVYVGNAVLVSGSGDTANLVVTLVNQGNDTQQVTVQPSGGQQFEVSLQPRQTRQFGDPPSEKTLVTGLGTKPGGLSTVTVTSGGNSVGLQVPVVTGALPPYGTLTPSPESTSLPSSSSTTGDMVPATPSPTPSPTPSR
ncbi:hypothetical protein [Leifsonia sp. SIMBA_070]|uniref:hypothetical protein n=1 Tax=Leifsonia sp. SIMBA_070 TaxID=3085810 RepID=UPI003978FFD8